MKQFFTRIKEFYFKCLDWISTDGLLHILCSTLLVVLFYSFFGIFIAILVTGLIGIIKEILDIFVRKTNTYKQSMKDIICDIIGILLGCGLSFLTGLQFIL